MNYSENNLLLSLHKWSRRQNENFHTEALVHLLRHVLKHDSKVAVNLLRRLTGGLLKLKPEDANLVRISTWVKTSTGKPDIEIKTKDHLIYIEVKVEAGLGDRQLERYRIDLQKKSAFKSKSLILLTRYPFVFKEDDEKPDLIIYWYEIAEWLEWELKEGGEHPSSSYVIEQFLEFLQARGMTIEQVGQELISKDFIQGFQSLNSLMNILNHILTLKKFSSKLDCLQNDAIGYSLGYSFKVNSGFCWIGILFDKPYKLCFETTGDLNLAAYTKIDFGYLWIEGKDLFWINELDLSSEEVNFFNLSKSMQLKTIEEFFTKSLTAAKQIQL